MKHLYLKETVNETLFKKGIRTRKMRIWYRKHMIELFLYLLGIETGLFIALVIWY